MWKKAFKKMSELTRHVTYASESDLADTTARIDKLVDLISIQQRQLTLIRMAVIKLEHDMRRS